ncbi:ankyrin repeat-containing domain protein [Xylaria cf. heliscus]|nr:ankyrin repeat-containing domain protein [Xylaria cf. heliscus]
MAQHVFKSGPAPLQPGNIFPHMIFWAFLYEVAKHSHYMKGYSNAVRLELRNPAVTDMLEWFLNAGAYIDIPVRLTVHPRLNQFDNFPYYTMYTPRNLMPTGLDYIYFNDFELYTYLAERSTQVETDVTRAGIHLSAREGIESLRVYLFSRLSHSPAEQDTFVETLLIEELLRSEQDDYVDFNIVNTLLDYSIGLQKFHLRLSASVMLCYTIKATNQQGMHSAVCPIIESLIHIGAVIISETMYHAVEAEGITLLRLLEKYGANFKDHGTKALCTAMRLNNYEAVNLLLAMGVDINATLQRDGKEMTVVALANVDIFEQKTRISPHSVPPFRHDLNSRVMSCEMLEYLISRNVKLRANPADPDIQHLLLLVILCGSCIFNVNWEDAYNKAKVLLDAEHLTNDRQRIAPCLLDACFWQLSTAQLSQRLVLMNYLLDHGVLASRSGVVAGLINNSAPENEILKLLDMGVDVNAYSGEHLECYCPAKAQYTPLQAAAAVGSLNWVRILIQRGADVNRPGKGESGRTALQAACACHSFQGYSGKIDLIKFLIANGADVNAPPVDCFGVTALQAAVRAGDFEVVLLLLDNGADINAAGPKVPGHCALDVSVLWGGLDMVQFFLNLGALSNDRGESGYKGAIYLAEDNDYLPIAGMIRRHALKNGKSGEELFNHYEEWGGHSSSEYGDDDDDMDDTDKASGACFEDQNYWEDWLPF